MTFDRVVARVLWRGRIEGVFPIPRGQGAIIVSNHRSPVDPGLIFLAAGRLVYWMIAKEYCSLPGLRWFFRAIGAIPVGRGGIDTAATKMAIRLAREGALVGIFPEGRINTTDKLLLAGRPGAALIALKARVPVVPCYVEGSPYGGHVWDPFVTPARVRLRIGRPIDISAFYGREDDREVVQALTRRFLREIAQLAGRPDFEPEIPSRRS